MINNYLNLADSHKVFIECILIIFLSVYLFNKLNVSLKGVLGFFVGLIFAWLYYDKIISIKKQKNNNLDDIKKQFPILKSLNNENDLILFYYNNKNLANYDIINYYQSINNAILFVEVHNRIMMNTQLGYYQYDVLEKHMILCLQHYNKIEFSISNQKDINNYLKNNLEALNKILSKYMNKVILHLNKNTTTTDIFVKKNDLNPKVKEYNKYDLII